MGAVITLLWLWVLLHIACTDAACSFDTPRVLTADSGTLESHDGYGSVNYEHNQNCEWLITVSTGWVVRLTMDDFELQKGSDCSYDHVTIYDGNSTSDPLIGKYCGTYDPVLNIPNSSSNQLLIVFTTNSFNTKSGFQFSWVRSMVTFSERKYTGKVLEGTKGSSNVTFTVPPHAEGGAGGITYSLVGSLASKLSIDSNTAAVRLSAEPYIQPYIGDPNGLFNHTELGIQATDADGDFATVPVSVKLYATAASALAGSLIVSSEDLDSLMKVNLDSGEIRFISGTESPYPSAVVLDIVENWLYWSDAITGALMRIQVSDQGAEAETFYQLQPVEDFHLRLTTEELPVTCSTPVARRSRLPAAASDGDELVDKFEERMKGLLRNELDARNLTTNSAKQNTPDKQETELCKKEVLRAIKALDEEKVVWDLSKHYPDPVNTAVTKKIIEVVRNVANVTNTSILKQRVKKLFDSRKRTFKEGQTDKLADRRSKMRRAQRLKSVTKRRFNALSEVRGLTEGQREDLQTHLQPQPGSRMGSCLVSSDDSDEGEDGEKIFLSRKMEGRSRQLAALMGTLEATARKNIQGCGTSLFRRIAGNKQSGRKYPQTLPQWMKAE